MAIVFDGPVSPDDVTSFVRTVPQTDGFLLDQLLPDRFFDDNEIDFAELTRTNRTARFRTWDGRIHVSERDTFTEKKVKLPPLSSSLNRGEYERLQLQFARTGGTNRDMMARAVYNDSEQLTREVRNRMELARGDALTDFKFTMMAASTGEPTGLEADFVAPAGHLVAPGTLWSDTTNATVLTNLVAWFDVYKADWGLPGAFWTSNAVVRLMQKNKEIIDAVFGSTQGKTRVNRNELTDLLASENLPPIRTYDANVDVDGATTRIIPDDRFLFTPENPADLGYTAWGLTATALELVNSANSDLAFEDAPGIVGVIDKIGPPYREFAFVDACGMPVISNPRALLVADVK